MDMTKFKAVISSTKEYNKSIRDISVREIGDKFKARLENCLDIRNSIGNFLRENFDWVVENANLESRHYSTLRLGGDYADYPKSYKDRFDIEVDVRENEDTGKLEYASYHICEINDDCAPILKCSGYEYPKLTAFHCTDDGKSETNSILNGDYSFLDDSKIAKIDLYLKHDEHYWNDIALPMFEIFLNHIKARKERVLNRLNGIVGNESVGKKIVITIAEA